MGVRIVTEPEAPKMLHSLWQQRRKANGFLVSKRSTGTELQCIKFN